MPHRPSRRADLQPALLVAAAFCFWLLFIGTYVAALPDHVASADGPERQAWVGD